MDGKPIVIREGYAWIRYNYDNLGREIEAAYFDAQNHPVEMELVVVRVIAAGTTAERIRLAAEDRILSYDGHTPSSVKQFIDAVVDASGNQTRVLIVRRGADELTLEVPPGRLGINIQMVLAGLHGAAR